MSMTKVLFGRGLNKAVAEEKGVEGVGEKGMVSNCLGDVGVVRNMFGVAVFGRDKCSGLDWIRWKISGRYRSEESI
jgi:hypothetical protein